MSAYNLEQNQEPSFTERVISTMRDAYKNLQTLLKDFPSIENGVDKSPEEQALSEAIGIFVTDNVVASNDITKIPRSPELSRAADAWLEAVLQSKLRSAMFLERLMQEEKNIEDLLKGRMIRAISLKHGFLVSSGNYVVGSNGSPMEIEAPFLGVEPDRGIIWLGEPEQAYQVQLFDNHDPQTLAAIIKVQ